MVNGSVTRRGFLALLPGALLVLSVRQGWTAPTAAKTQTKHPAPRRGIDASRVLAATDIEHGGPETRAAFDLVRQVPQVVDGIRCHCGCSEMEGYYSLLSCFETDGMAQHCEVCQGLARLAHRMHRAGKSLDQIRAAVDAYPR